jgi:hypothetical protein
MKCWKLLMRVWILGFLVNLFFFVGQAMAIGEAKYKILEKQNDFELRQYEHRRSFQSR